MDINKLIERDRYKNDTVRICEFLGFTDTDQLKKAKFFSIEETRSPIPFLGNITINNNDPTWHLCEIIDDKENELYSVDYGYKIRLQICDGCYGSHLYYQSSFLSFLKQGLIVYCPNENKYQIEHIVCGEPLYGDVMLVHEFDALIERK